jgi:predicted dehydrogenase
MTTNDRSNLRVAILGCGQIADAHIQEIGKITGARVEAVCDRESDLAYQAAARFAVPQYYDDLERMLSEVKPDVVHITTPPHTHFALASICLRHGSHVYVEKPFAIDADETKRLLALARAEQKLACVGHDHLFDPIWIEALRRIAAGTLGTVVHVDSQQGYDTGGPFGRLIQTDPRHWIHRLPGGIIQNVISHAICKVTPFLIDDDPEVLAMAFGDGSSTILPSQLRVVLRGEVVSATVTLLSGAKPVRRVARIYGTKGGIEVDFEAGLIRDIRSAALPGAPGRIETPFRQAIEATMNTGRAIKRFARSELQYFAGMRALFEALYLAVRNGGPPPISYDEIQRVANIMDAVFRSARCGSSPSPLDEQTGARS